jgi:single-stranded DNA-binding protein
MTATVLIIGRDPVMRTAKTGKAFVTALLRSESQGETLWVNAVAFDESAQAELMRLKAGESLSVQGKLRVSIYEKAGEHRPSLDVVASHVLALRQPPKSLAAPRFHGVVERA